MKRALVLLFLSLTLLSAQDLLKDLHWRQIGPFRGGRALAVAGSTAQRDVFFFGATGGGIWKTTDAGASWEPMSDGQLGTGSVGAIAVSESDPNVIYAGMGEACIRGNASHGDGVYKSMDGGKTWKNIGLKETQHIGAIRIHPKNPDVVYVAALGHQFGPNAERGVYRSMDGGKTWKQILTRGPKAGAVDLSMDPTNPNVIYAAFWEVYRTAYSLESGGPGSGVWKTTDGGDNWTDLTHAPGMPRGVQGRIGVSVSPANPERVWAIVEAEDGGVFRSDNAGKNWTKVNSDRNLRQRAWYYTHILADPILPNRVYVLNTGFYRSDDAGRTYMALPTPHGDNHGIWIDPKDNNRIINSNDGGTNVSFNGGHTWSQQNQQPTAQFYRVILDNDFPYNVYGAQQDNSTIRTPSRGTGGGITEKDWYDVGGGESGWIAYDPRDTNIVYAGSYGGLITRYDKRIGQRRDINPWPDNPMGHPASDLKYRFQWNFPLLISPHDPAMIYTAAQSVFKSTNEGQSWELISGDLTRNERSRQGSSGGPLTKDNTSIEYYSTIFTIDESPITKGLLWVGSDDGLVHVSRDAGKSWTNVTPKDMPEWVQINSIEASPNDPATAYFAATLYKADDYRPFLYKTTDYGKTWTKIVNGIPNNAFTRVIREDPNHKGFLVAGTELGLYMSMDAGANWQSMQFKLPVVPITDLAFHKRDKELVAATQGRAFWIFDDLPLLYQTKDSVKNEDVHLFQPKEAYRSGGGGRGGGGQRGGGAVGANPPGGTVVYYALKAKPQGEVVLEFLDAKGALVKKFSSKDAAGAGPQRRGPAADDDDEGPRFAAPARVPVNAGMNRFVWDLRYPDATTFPNLIMWAGSTRGPQVPPGQYSVRLTVDGKTQTQSFAILKDPRVKATQEDLEKQSALSLQLRDKLSQANEGVVKIRDVRKQVSEYVDRLKDDPASKKVVDAAKEFAKKLTAIEEELYQTKNQSSQDPLNFPIKLNNRVAALLGTVQSADSAPTAQSYMVYEGLASEVNAQLRKLDTLLKDDLTTFNKLVRDQNVPAVILKK
ncbi:MAG: glycosyl hydrolase [Bryobacteraceae bacterium]